MEEASESPLPPPVPAPEPSSTLATEPAPEEAPPVDKSAHLVDPIDDLDRLVANADTTAIESIEDTGARVARLIAKFEQGTAK